MSTPSRKTVMKSSDGKLFEAEEAAAQLSLMIKHMIDDNRAEYRVPITGDILSRVIAYCRKHASAAVADDEALKSFDSEFIKVDEATLFHMANAARFLDIKCLSNLLCEALADRRKKRKSNRELHRRVSQKTFDLNSMKVLLGSPN